MVYPKMVAIFRGIQDLEEDTLDESIMTYISTALGNIGKEISFMEIVQDNIGAVRIIENLMHRDDIRMRRSCPV